MTATDNQELKYEGTAKAETLLNNLPGVFADFTGPVGYSQPNNTSKFPGKPANPIKVVSEEPVSTFSIDVDTASYGVVRDYLNEGALPPADAVRVEEMVNYFDYAYPLAGIAQEPFKATYAVYPTPWNKDTQILHIGIKGYDLPKAARPPANLVFLIDTSGSMDEPNKLPLLKSAFHLLVDQLGAKDRVAIVAYAGAAGVVLEPTSGADKAKILAALDQLEPAARPRAARASAWPTSWPRTTSSRTASTA